MWVPSNCLCGHALYYHPINQNPRFCLAGAGEARCPCPGYVARMLNGGTPIPSNALTADGQQLKCFTCGHGKGDHAVPGSEKVGCRPDAVICSCEGFKNTFDPGGFYLGPSTPSAPGAPQGGMVGTRSRDGFSCDVCGHRVTLHYQSYSASSLFCSGTPDPHECGGHGLGKLRSGVEALVQKELDAPSLADTFCPCGHLGSAHGGEGACQWRGISCGEGYGAACGPAPDFGALGRDGIGEIRRGDDGLSLRREPKDFDERLLGGDVYIVYYRDRAGAGAKSPWVQVWPDAFRHGLIHGRGAAIDFARALEDKLAIAGMPWKGEVLVLRVAPLAREDW